MSGGLKEMALKTSTILKLKGDRLAFQGPGLSLGINTIGVDGGPMTVSQEREADIWVYALIVTFRQMR